MQLNQKFRTLSQNKALLLSLNYYLIFIYLGLGMGAFGTTLHSLAAQNGVTIGSMCLLVLIGSLGYTLVNFLSGRVFDRLPAHPVMGVGLLVIALGFILMMGGSMPEPDMWDNDLIFSFRRITLAPFLVITGFVIEIYAIFKRW